LSAPSSLKPTSSDPIVAPLNTARTVSKSVPRSQVSIVTSPDCEGCSRYQADEVQGGASETVVQLGAVVRLVRRPTLGSPASAVASRLVADTCWPTASAAADPKLSFGGGDALAVPAPQASAVARTRAASGALGMRPRRLPVG